MSHLAYTSPYHYGGLHGGYGHGYGSGLHGYGHELHGYGSGLHGYGSGLHGYSNLYGSHLVGSHLDHHWREKIWRFFHIYFILKHIKIWKIRILLPFQLIEDFLNFIKF